MKNASNVDLSLINFKIWLTRTCNTFLYNSQDNWAMLEDIRNDTIATFLLRKCSLTEVQLDTILASQEIGNLDFKRGLRENHKVSKGAFARTLKQAHDNVEESI